jgi:outer membrane protein OmpA-like peptidoglycan-associated protein
MNGSSLLKNRPGVLCVATAGVLVAAALLSGCSEGSARTSLPAQSSTPSSTPVASGSFSVPNSAPAQISVPTTLIPRGLDLPTEGPVKINPPTCTITLAYAASTLGFAFNSAVISPAGAQVISETTQVLAGADQVTVTGYTSSEGSYSYNFALSLARAKSTAALLMPLLPGAKLTIVGDGPLDPVASNATEAGRKENRRTVISAHVNRPQCTGGAVDPSS